MKIMHVSSAGPRSGNIAATIGRRISAILDYIRKMLPLTGRRSGGDSGENTGEDYVI